MSTPSDVKVAFEGVAEVLRHEPELGIGTGTSVTTVTDGLRCEIAEDNWTMQVDMPTAAGGSSSAPTPGVLGRAALGSCLALTYTMWAAKEGIEIQRLQIVIEADYDEGALFGTSDSHAGYAEVRCRVRIESLADEADIVRLLDEADRHSPYLDVFARAQRVVRQLELTSAGAEHH